MTDEEIFYKNINERKFPFSHNFKDFKEFFYFLENSLGLYFHPSSFEVSKDIFFEIDDNIILYIYTNYSFLGGMITTRIRLKEQDVWYAGLNVLIKDYTYSKFLFDRGIYELIERVFYATSRIK